MKSGKTLALFLSALAVLAAPMAVTGASAQEKKRFYAVGSFNTGTQPYIYASALAGLLRQHTKDIELSSEATGGTNQNLDLMRRNELQMATVSTDRLYAAFYGEGAWADKKTEAYILFQCLNSAVLFFADASSQIKTPADLKGKKVVIGPAGSSSEVKNAAILQAYGFTRKPNTNSEFNELTTVRLNLGESAQALAQNSVDAVLNIQQAPDAFFSELALSRSMRISGIPPAMFPKIHAIYPAMWPTMIPKGTYKGQNEDITTLGDPSYLVATKAVSEQDAYLLTKLYVEVLLPKLAETVAFVKPYLLDKTLLTKSMVVPAHPGAAKYYAEKGIPLDMVKIK